jgi:hypothetical protein
MRGIAAANPIFLPLKSGCQSSASRTGQTSRTKYNCPQAVIVGIEKQGLSSVVLDRDLDQEKNPPIAGRTYR